MAKRCDTGTALDAMLGGGFPIGHSILISGGPGTGKTIFASQILFHGAARGEKAVMLSTEPPFKNLAQLRNFAFFNDATISSGKLEIFELQAMLQNVAGRLVAKPSETWVIDTVTEMVEQNDVKRLAIDSINGLSLILKAPQLRSFLAHLSLAAASLGCTTFFISENAQAFSAASYNAEIYVADTAIAFESAAERMRNVRRARIIKSRAGNFPLEPIAFTITGNGVEFFPRPVRKGVSTDFSARISTGLKPLDAMLGGGVWKNGAILVSGPGGSGKTITAMHFAAEGLAKGESVLFASFEDSKEDLLKQAAGIGLKIDKAAFHCIPPESAEPDEHVNKILSLARAEKARRVVVDSVTSLQNVFGQKAAQEFLAFTSSASKDLGASLVATSGSSEFVGGREVSSVEVSSAIDTVLMQRYVEFGSEIKRSLSVLKHRGSEHDKRIVNYEIGRKGIEVKGVFAGLEGVLSGFARKSPEEKFVEAFKM
jgi:circadian clock protein KaiC